MINTDSNTGLQIRQAQPHEANALTQLAMQSKAHWNYSPEQLAMWRGELTVPLEKIESGAAYVGEINHEIVAMMVIVPATIKWKLDYFFVAPSHMEQGIGKEMFNFALALARQRGARALTIDADPYAEPFYLACGAIRSHTIAAPIEADQNRVRPQMLFTILPPPKK